MSSFASVTSPFSSPSVLGKRNARDPATPTAPHPKRPAVDTARQRRLQVGHGAPDVGPSVQGVGKPTGGRLCAPEELVRLLADVHPAVVARWKHGPDGKDIATPFGTRNIASIVAEYATAPMRNIRGRHGPLLWTAIALRREIEDRLHAGHCDSTIHGIPIRMCELDGNTLYFEASKGSERAVNTWGARQDTYRPSTSSSRYRFMCGLNDLAVSMQTMEPPHDLFRQWPAVQRLQKTHNLLPAAMALLPCLRQTTLDLRTPPFLFSQLKDGKPDTDGSGWQVLPKFTTDDKQHNVLSLLNQFAQDVAGVADDDDDGGPLGIEHLYVPADLPLYAQCPDGSNKHSFLRELLANLRDLPDLRSLWVEVPLRLSTLDLSALGALTRLELRPGALFQTPYLLCIKGSGMTLHMPDPCLDKIVVANEDGALLSVRHLSAISGPDMVLETTSSEIGADECWRRPLLAFEITPGMVVMIGNHDQPMRVMHSKRDINEGLFLDLTSTAQLQMHHQPVAQFKEHNADGWNYTLHLSAKEIDLYKVSRASLPSAFGRNFDADPAVVNTRDLGFGPRRGDLLDMRIGDGSLCRVKFDDPVVTPEYNHVRAWFYRVGDFFGLTPIVLPAGCTNRGTFISFDGTVQGFRTLLDQSFVPVRQDEKSPPVAGAAIVAEPSSNLPPRSER